MKWLASIFLFALLCVVGNAQTFVVGCDGPDSGLSTEQLHFDITVQTYNPGGVHNIEFGAFIRTSPTPNGWDQVTADSTWGTGGWTGWGDVTYTTYFLGAGNVVNIHVTVTTDPGFKGELTVEAYAQLSGGYRVTNKKTTKIGPMKVKLLDSLTGSPLIPAELEPSVLRWSKIEEMKFSLKTRRCKVRVEAPTAPGTWIRAYVTSAAGSGGHDSDKHTGLRPHGWLKPVGGSVPALPGSTDYNSYEGPNPFRKQLDGLGTAEFDFVAPELGGNETLVVVTEKVLPADRYEVPQPIRLRFAGLGLLQDNDDLDLYSSNWDNEKHSSRFYASPDTAQAIYALAKNWRNETATTLKVNDISLTDGGLFDIAGTYTYSHFGHRLGREFDVGSLTPKSVKFERVVNEQGWWATLAEGDHYHLSQGENPVTHAPLMGRVSTALKSYETHWDNQTNRVLAVVLTFQNRGGLDSVSNTLTELTPDNPNVVVQAGWDDDMGPIGIRQTFTKTVLLTVPVGVSKFKLVAKGVSESAERPGETFPFRGDFKPGQAAITDTTTIAVSTGPLAIDRVTLSENNIGANATFTGRVWLTETAPTNTVVSLSSDDPASAVPTANSVVVPAGQYSVEFYIKTKGVPPKNDIKIGAALSGSAPVYVKFNLLVGPKSMTITPSPATKDGNVTITMELTAALPAPNTAGLYLNATYFQAPAGTQSILFSGASIKAIVKKVIKTGTVSVTLGLNKGSVATSLQINP